MSSEIVNYILEQLDIGNKAAVAALFVKGAVNEADQHLLVEHAITTNSTELLRRIVETAKNNLTYAVALQCMFADKQLDLAKYFIEEIGINPHFAIYYQRSSYTIHQVYTKQTDKNLTLIDDYLSVATKIFNALETFAIPLEDRKQYFRSEACILAAKNGLITSREVLNKLLGKSKFRTQIRI